MTGLKAEGLTNPLLQSSAVAIPARVDIPFPGTHSGARALRRRPDRWELSC